MNNFKAFGMQLNLHSECVNDFDNSSVSDISAALIRLYSNFESKKVSHPINLEFEDENCKANKIKFKDSGSLIRVADMNNVVLAHWYIYDAPSDY